MARGRAAPRFVVSGRLRGALPGIGAAVGTATSLAVEPLLGGLPGPAGFALAVVCGGIGAIAGGRVQDLAARLRARELARFDLQRPADPGTVGAPGLVIGRTFHSAVRRLVDCLVAPASAWLCIEGESGLGKSTLVRSALHDPRVVTRFVAANRSDRRFVIDFDEVGCSGSRALTVLRSRLGAHADAEVALDLRRHPSLLVLDHVDLFFRAGRSEELRELLVWLASAVAESTRVVLIVQGERVRDIESLGDFAPQRFKLPRLDDRDALALFDGYAPTFTKLDLGDLAVVERLVAVFCGLPRAVRLLALTMEAEATDPVDPAPAHEVVLRQERLLRDGVIGHLAAESGDVDRNLSLEFAVRLVLSSRLVTSDVRQALADIAVLPAGLGLDDAPTVLSSARGTLRPRARIGRMLRLGLVFGGEAGVITEPAVAMHLSSAEGVLPRVAAKRAWCRRGASAASAPQWLTSNARNVREAIEAGWPDAPHLAVAALVTGWSDANPEALVTAATEASEERLAMAAMECPPRSVSAAILDEARARRALVVTGDASVAASLLHRAASEYERRHMYRDQARTLRWLVRCDASLGDPHHALRHLKKLGVLASIYRAYDEKYSSAEAAALDYLTTVLDQNTLLKDPNPHEPVVALIELARLASYDQAFDETQFESARTATLEQLSDAQAALERMPEPCARCNSRIDLELGHVAIYKGWYDDQSFSDADSAAHSYLLCGMKGDPPPDVPLELCLLARFRRVYDAMAFQSAESAMFAYAHETVKLCGDTYEYRQPLARALYELGRLARYHARYDESAFASAPLAALSYFARSLGLYASLSESANSAWTHGGIADNSLELGLLAMDEGVFDNERYENSRSAATALLRSALRSYDTTCRNDRNRAIACERVLQLSSHLA